MNKTETVMWKSPSESTCTGVQDHHARTFSSSVSTFEADDNLKQHVNVNEKALQSLSTLTKLVLHKVLCSFSLGGPVEASRLSKVLAISKKAFCKSFFARILIRQVQSLHEQTTIAANHDQRLRE